MTNVEASEVLEQWIAKNSPCNGLEQALLRAVTALRHQPEPQKIHDDPIGQQCETCGKVQLDVTKTTCWNCGSTNLRPIYTTSEVQLAKKVGFCEKHKWLRDACDPNACAQCSLDKFRERAEQAERKVEELHNALIAKAEEGLCGSPSPKQTETARMWRESKGYKTTYSRPNQASLLPDNFHLLPEQFDKALALYAEERMQEIFRAALRGELSLGSGKE